MASLARSNLVARKGRTLLSILVVALGTSLLLLLVGFAQGTMREIAERMVKTNADIIVLRKGSNPLIMSSSSNLPMSLGPALRKVDGVASVTPLAVTSVVINNQATRIYGLARADLERLLRDYKFLKGRIFEKDDEAVIDNRIARIEGLALGDTIAGPAETCFTVVGIVEAGMLGRIYVERQGLQKLLREPDMVWAYLVGCADGGRAPDVAARIESQFRIAGTELVRNYYQVLSRSLREMQYVIKGIVVLTLIMSFLVILLGMYTSVLERTREIGILKALGAGRAFILREVLTESVIVALCGVGLGIVLSFAGRFFIERSYPHYCVELSARWLAAAVAVGLVAGFAGAALPGWRAASEDPIVALNYE